MNLSARERNLAAFFLAYVGVVYELGFAQLLSATLGNTYFRYATTIGLFTLSLGLASLFHERWKFSLQKIQLALVFAGIFGALWIRVCDPAKFPWTGLATLLSYLPILVVGLLTGFELPILLEQTENSASSTILAWDYAGMFVATMLFPLWLLPAWGVMGSLVSASLLNLLAFIFMLRRNSE